MLQSLFQTLLLFGKMINLPSLSLVWFYGPYSATEFLEHFFGQCDCRNGWSDHRLGRHCGLPGSVFVKNQEGAQ